MHKKAKKSTPRFPRIKQKEARETFISLHPHFTECWKKAQKYYGRSAIRNVYRVIAYEIDEILFRDPTTDFSSLLQYLEKLLREGTTDVRGIVAVYFIESLLTTSDFEPDLIAPLLRNLGPISRAYALQYNLSIGGENLGLEK